MTGSKTTIHIEDELDRWKWVCPRGHRQWEPTNFHFWCAACARANDASGEFDELRNKATGEVLEREQLELETPVGPYEEVKT